MSELKLDFNSILPENQVINHLQINKQKLIKVSRERVVSLEAQRRTNEAKITVL